MLRAALFFTCIGSVTADAAVATKAAPKQKETHQQKEDNKLQSREDQIKAGRKEVHNAMASMADHQTRLVALSKDDKQIDAISSEIVSRVNPTLTHAQKKDLEADYNQQLSTIKQVNISQSGGERLVAEHEAAAEKDLNTLRDASRKDAKNLRKEFSSARRDAHTEVRQFSKNSRSALSLMGSPTGLEMAMEKDGKGGYDHAENLLQHEKDTLADKVDGLHDSMDDLIDEIYSKVYDRVDAKADTLEEEASTRTTQRRQALRDAKQTLQMQGSLSRVEDKLHRLEKQMTASKQASQEELASSPATVRTNTICTALIVAGLAASLVMHAMQRRAESRTIIQPDSFA